MNLCVRTSDEETIWIHESRPELWQNRVGVRENILWRRSAERQIEVGVVDPDTPLAPRDSGVEPWNDLSDNQHLLAACLQEAFAAFLDHTDDRIDLWWQEAEVHGVLPLDERRVELFILRLNAQSVLRPDRRNVYRPPMTPIPTRTAASLTDTVVDLTARVTAAAGDEGALLATGNENYGLSASERTTARPRQPATRRRSRSPAGSTMSRSSCPTAATRTPTRSSPHANGRASELRPTGVELGAGLAPAADAHDARVVLPGRRLDGA
jgi:hypothetical protein